MEKKTKSKIELLPKQMRMIQSTAPEILYSGAFGAGKTRGLCYKALTHALHKGNLVGLCRKTRASLQQTTLRVLLKQDGDLPPVLPEGTYTHRITDSLISLHDGGDIYYFGFDDTLRVASLNLGCVCVDEGVELDEDEYTMLEGRLRNTADPHRQIVTATNPGPPTHFLYNRFFKQHDPTRLLIEARSTENYLLPDDYLRRLRKFKGQYRDRYVLGKWVAFEGLIYDNFSRDVHIVHRDLREFKRLIVGVDEGYEDPTALSLWGVDGDGRLHLLAVFYQRHVLQRNVVQTCVRFGADLLPAVEREFVVDPSAAGLKAALDAAGLYVAEDVDNDIFDGVQETRNRFDKSGDGRPRLTIEPGIPGLEFFLTEIDSYHRGKDERPAKGLLDHLLDTMRYVVMYLRDEAAPRIISLEPRAEERPDPKDRHIEYELSSHEDDDGISTEHIFETEKAWQS